MRENGTIRIRHCHKTKSWERRIKYDGEGKLYDKNTKPEQNGTKIGYGVPNTLVRVNGKIRILSRYRTAQKLRTVRRTKCNSEGKRYDKNTGMAKKSLTAYQIRHLYKNQINCDNKSINQFLIFKNSL